MSKISLEGIENLLRKYISPLEKHLESMAAEIIKLEAKIVKLEYQDPFKVKPTVALKNPPSQSKPNARGLQVVEGKNVAAKVNIVAQPTTDRSTRATVRAQRSAARTAAAGGKGERASITPLRKAAHDADENTPRSLKSAELQNTDTYTTDADVGVSTALEGKEHSTGTNNDDGGGWVEVKHKRHYRKPIPARAVVTGKGSADDGIKTVERIRKVHACFFRPETTTDNIKSFLKRKNADHEYQVEKLTLKHEFYSSFVISIPYSAYDFFMSAEIWPLGTKVSEWFRRSGGRAQRAPHHCTRAGAASESAQPQPQSAAPAVGDLHYPRRSTDSTEPAASRSADDVTSADVPQKFDVSKKRGKEAVVELRRKKQEKLDEQKKLLDRKLHARETANEISRDKSSIVASKLLKASSSKTGPDATENENTQQRPEIQTANIVFKEGSNNKENSGNKAEVVDMATQWN